MNYEWLDPLGRGYVKQPHWCNLIELTWYYIVFGSYLKNLQQGGELWGEECKILLVEFFNYWRRQSGDRSSTMLVKAQASAKDSGPVDQPCTTCTKEDAINHSIDRPEDAPAVEEID